VSDTESLYKHIFHDLLKRTDNRISLHAILLFCVAVLIYQKFAEQICLVFKQILCNVAFWDFSCVFWATSIPKGNLTRTYFWTAKHFNDNHWTSRLRYELQLKLWALSTFQILLIFPNCLGGRFSQKSDVFISFHLICIDIRDKQYSLENSILTLS